MIKETKQLLKVVERFFVKNEYLLMGVYLVIFVILNFNRVIFLDFENDYLFYKEFYPEYFIQISVVLYLLSLPFAIYELRRFKKLFNFRLRVSTKSDLISFAVSVIVLSSALLCLIFLALEWFLFMVFIIIFTNSFLEWSKICWQSFKKRSLLKSVKSSTFELITVFCFLYTTFTFFLTIGVMYPSSPYFYKNCDFDSEYYLYEDTKAGLYGVYKLVWGDILFKELTGDQYANFQCREAE